MPPDTGLQAIEHFAQTLNSMNIPALVTFVLALFVTVPLAGGWLIIRHMNKQLDKFSEQLNNKDEQINARDAQLGSALALATKAAAGAESLREALTEGLKATGKSIDETVDLVIEAVAKQVESTQAAIQARFGKLETAVGVLGPQIDAGFRATKSDLESHHTRTQEAFALLREGQQQMMAGLERLIQDEVQDRGHDERMLSLMEDVAGQVGTACAGIEKLRGEMDDAVHRSA